MGRITELKHSRDEEVREAELLTSTKRKIRRPINLLIPLEIQEARISDDNEPTQVTPSPGKTGENDVVNSRAHTRPYNLRQRTPKNTGENDVVNSRAHARPYNLRQRTPKNYAQDVYTATMASTVQGIKPKWFLFHIMILSLIQVCSCRTTLCGSVGCANKEYFTVRQPYVAEASGVFDKCANEIGITQIAPRYFHSVMFDKALSFENEKPFQRYVEPFQRYVACDDYAYPHIIDENARQFQKDRGCNITHRILSTSSLLTSADYLIRWKLRVNEVGNLKEQLRQAQRSLHQLKCAIPILPDADVLYEKIVRTCTDHYTHTQAVTSLKEKFRRLRLSDKPSEQRLSEIGSLNLEIDYLTLQFRFCRSQLFTLFSVPPLLIALEKMTIQSWETLMRRPQETSPNKPLVMDLSTLENITSDQLQALNSLRFSLNDLRAEAQNDADKEQLPFEGELRNELDSMQQFNLDIQDAVRNALHGKAPAPVQDAGEGTPKVRGEDEIIRENEEFIEGLIESESEHDDHDDQVSADEDMGSDSAHDDLSEAEGSEEEPEEPEQEEPEDLDEDQRELEDEDDIPEDIPRRENLRRRAIQIENEIRSTEQAIRNFEEILRQYEQEPLCPPRRFDHGRIVRGNERYMKCAFCEASGIHYSDSCTAFRDPLERRELIREARRCWTCLERMCARGATCKKSSDCFGQCKSLTLLLERVFAVQKVYNDPKDSDFKGDKEQWNDYNCDAKMMYFVCKKKYIPEC
ncbi:unnamed protein product, partial [Haemonchus placei]|uniref:Fibrinogen C-terminal domain-containing protein n=1 Tax=Haemonchus placei TaxID=6290 RepID=A0A0N4X0F9_HAEPC